MKTSEFFKTEISKLREEMSVAKKELAEPKLDEKRAKQLRGTVKRNKKKIEEYTFFKNYVETNPTQEFLLKESDRLSNRINKYLELYIPLAEDKYSKKQCSDHKKKYEKEMDIPKLRRQLSAVNFLK